MAEAYVLVQTEVGRARVVARQLAALSGVVSAEYVTGPYDVVVRGSASDTTALHRDVISAVQQTLGVTRTVTCPVTEADGA